MSGLLGEKIGMTQIYTASGDWVPVTVVRMGPCFVVTKKMASRDGYDAIQLGYGAAKEQRLDKARKGHLDSKGAKPLRVLREMRTAHADSYEPGDMLTVSSFAVGDMVDVIGISKGKGFQGVMKRHHFGGMNASHGVSVSHRAAGSIGQRTWPGKVFKGKRMAGRMGGERVTVKNLQVMGVEPEQNILLVKGAVPGPNHSLLEVHPVAGDFEKRFLDSKVKKDKPAVEAAQEA